jgi:hypothetical protein
MELIYPLMLVMCASMLVFHLYKRDVKHKAIDKSTVDILEMHNRIVSNLFRDVSTVIGELKDRIEYLENKKKD